MLHCANKVLFVGSKVQLPTWLQVGSLNDGPTISHAGIRPCWVINYPSQCEVEYWYSHTYTLHWWVGEGNVAGTFINTDESWRYCENPLPRATIILIVGCIQNLPNMAMNVYCAKLWWNTCKFWVYRLYTNDLYNACKLSPGVWLQAATRKFHKSFKVLPSLYYMKNKPLGIWPRC